MRTFILTVFSFLLFNACEDSNSELWHFNNLETIAGHAVEVEGDPELLETELGLATYFDGVEDRLLVDSNPIAGSNAFTVEVVFKADDAYNTNYDPRFVHIQDPADSVEKRLMLELRINNRGELYLDGFIKTDMAKLALIDSSLTHPCNTWLHAAVTYDGSTLKTYMNGVLELEKKVLFKNEVINPSGKVSIGGRMNRVDYFKGYIKYFKVTRAVIEPSEFITIE